MMVPGTLCLCVRHLKCTGRTWWPLCKRWVNRLLHRTVWSQLGPASCLCCFDNALQDEDSVGEPPPPTPNARLRLLCLPLATQQWKKQKMIQAGQLQKYLTAINALTSKPRSKKGIRSRTIRTRQQAVEKWGQKGCLPQSVPHCSNAGPVRWSRVMGCNVCGANLTCVHRHMPRLKKKTKKKKDESFLRLVGVLWGSEQNIYQ